MELRKVIFRLGDADGFFPNKSPEQIKYDEEISKDRYGYFHCWVPSLIHDPELGKKVPTTCALIEDTEGALHEVLIKHVKFCTPIEYVKV